MEFNHALYVAGEVEKLLMSEAALKYGNLAFEGFTNDPLRTMIDLPALIDNGNELIDLVPMQFPVSMLYHNLNGKMIWTVNISCSPDATTGSTSAGRSRSRNHATLAAMIRLFVQEQVALQKAAEKAAADQLEPA